MNSSDTPEPIPADDLGPAERKVLSIVHLNTNPMQGEWVSKSVIKTTACPYGELSGSKADDTLDRLEDRGLIIQSEQGYQTAEGVGRPKHPGEK